MKKKKIIYGILAFIIGLFSGGILAFCSADGVYRNSTGGLISIIYNNGANVLTLQDKNLGATCTNLNESCSYGARYQFGNNYPFYGNVSSNDIVAGAPNVDLGDYGPGNYYNSNGIFYTDLTSSNYDIRGGVTATNEARQGPCPNGYYIIDNWENIVDIFDNSIGTTNFYAYLKMPLAGYMERTGEEVGTVGQIGDRGNYWASNSYSSSNGYRINIFNGGNDSAFDENKSYGFSVRCFKSTPETPDYTRTTLFGTQLERPTTITVLYNNGNSSKDVACNGDNIIQIDGLSSETSTNVFTPYYYISYRDEDNQVLTESYSKSNLYLDNGLFKKTYTGDNERVLTVQGTSNGSLFTGYLPVFDVTGGINEPTESGNIFNNFAENSVKFTLSNIPSYIQYVILLFILFFILGFIRKFRRK